MIYAGATILGRIVIGKGSSIGGNVWLTNGVPPGSRTYAGRGPGSALPARRRDLRPGPAEPSHRKETRPYDYQ